MDILFIYLAESEGFEPPVRRNAYTAFRVRHFRPLSQLSFAFGYKIAMVHTALLNGRATCASALPTANASLVYIGDPINGFQRKKRAKVLLFFELCK